MGKVLRTNRIAVTSGKNVQAPSVVGLPSPGLDDKKRFVNNWIPRLFDVSRVADNVHVAWTPLPLSHSADRMFSWVVSEPPQGDLLLQSPSLVTVAPTCLPKAAPRSQRVLALFAFKHVKSGQLDRVELCEELRNIADPVCSLNANQRSLYGDRIVLFIVAYPSDRVILQDVLSTTDKLFPDNEGRSGAHGTETLTFSTLPFETVLVPHNVLSDFLTNVPPAVAEGVSMASTPSQQPPSEQS